MNHVDLPFTAASKSMAIKPNSVAYSARVIHSRKIRSLKGVHKIKSSFHQDAIELRRPVKHIGDKYIAIKRIGRGTFGDIWKVQDKTQNKKEYVIKMVRADKIRSIKERKKYYRMFDFEAKKLIKLSRIQTTEKGKDFIIKCKEVIYTPFGAPLIVTELCSCSLLQYMKYMKCCSFLTIRYIAVQLLSAMTFIHGAGAMVHSDLKPENVLIHQMVSNNMPLIKIVDFGNALPVNVKIKTFDVQTLWYRAPELLFGNSNEISCLMDLWSIGCILYELYSVNKPCKYQRLFNEIDVIRQIYKTLGSFPNYLYNTFKSRNYQDIFVEYSSSSSYIALKNMRKNKLIQRNNDYSSEFATFADFIAVLLDLNPVTRYNSEDALKHVFISADFADKSDLGTHRHPILKSSNDDQRQNRIHQQIKDYEMANYNNNTEIIVKQHLH